MPKPRAKLQQQRGPGAAAGGAVSPRAASHPGRQEADAAQEELQQVAKEPVLQKTLDALAAVLPRALRRFQATEEATAGTRSGSSSSKCSSAAELVPALPAGLATRLEDELSLLRRTVQLDTSSSIADPGASLRATVAMRRADVWPLLLQLTCYSGRRVLQVLQPRGGIAAEAVACGGPATAAATAGGSPATLATAAAASNKESSSDNRCAGGLGSAALDREEATEAAREARSLQTAAMLAVISCIRPISLAAHEGGGGASAAPPPSASVSAAAAGSYCAIRIARALIRADILRLQACVAARAADGITALLPQKAGQQQQQQRQQQQQPRHETAAIAPAMSPAAAGGAAAAPSAAADKSTSPSVAAAVAAGDYGCAGFVMAALALEMRGAQPRPAAPGTHACAGGGSSAAAAGYEQPLPELVLTELAVSGYLEQAARLAVAWARLAVSCGSSSSGIDGAVMAQAFAEDGYMDSFKALSSVAPVAVAWVDKPWKHWGRSPPPPPSPPLPPPPWGACLRFLALSQVVVTLEAAGYGGGVRGVWGLPEELAAGLPVLGEWTANGNSMIDLREVLQVHRDMLVNMQRLQRNVAVTAAYTQEAHERLAKQHQGQQDRAQVLEEEKALLVKVEEAQTELAALQQDSKCLVLRQQQLQARLSLPVAAAAAAAVVPAAATPPRSQAPAVSTARVHDTLQQLPQLQAPMTTTERQLRRQHQQPCEDAYLLHPQPFELLHAVVEADLACASVAPASPPAAEMVASAAHSAAASGGASSGGSSSRGGCSGSADGGGGGGWHFPVSRRALYEVLLRVADLAAAPPAAPPAVLDLTSADTAAGSSNSQAAGGSAGGRSGDAVAGGPGGGADSTCKSSVPEGPWLRLQPQHAWDAGCAALALARRLQLRQRQPPRHELGHASSAADAAVRAVPASVAAASGPNDLAQAPAVDNSNDGSGDSSCGGDITSGEGGGGGGGYPLLSPRWWRTVAALLRAGVLNDSGDSCQPPVEGSDPRVRQTLSVHAVLRLERLPGLLLPPRAPPALEVALAAGLVPAVEAALRRAPTAAAAADLTAAFLNLPRISEAGSGGCWPVLQQLLAFAPPAQMAALITSLGKRAHATLNVDALQMSLRDVLAQLRFCMTPVDLLLRSPYAWPKAEARDAVGGRPTCEPALLVWAERCNTAAAAHKAALKASSRVQMAAGRSRSLAGQGSNSAAGAAAAAYDDDSSSGAGWLAATVGLVGRGGGSSAGNAQAQEGEQAQPVQERVLRLRTRQLRLLLSHALHRWLPAVCRYASLLLRTANAQPLAPVSQLLTWAEPALFALLKAEAEVERLAQEPVQQQGAAAAGDIMDSSRSAAAAATAASAATAAAVAASWRQWLLRDLDVVGVMEAALAALRRAPCSGPLGADLGHVHANLILTLPVAVAAIPDALIPVLQPPSDPPAPTAPRNYQQPGSPARLWQAESLRALLLRPGVGVFSADEVCGLLQGVEDLRSFGSSSAGAAAGSSSSSSSAGAGSSSVGGGAVGFKGGPQCRLAGIAWRPGDFGTLVPLSPWEVMQEGRALAAELGCSDGSGSGGSSEAASSSGSCSTRHGPPGLVSVLPDSCANPRCADLAGDSEWSAGGASGGVAGGGGSSMRACGGCGAVRYCCRECQVAHWRAGHKEACAAFAAAVKARPQ